MNPPVSLEATNELLGAIRNQFYPDEPKRFFQDRNMLLQAVTFPAKWLHERGVRLPETRYRTILLDILTTIKRHGNTARIQRFSAYLLHSVQEHMRHHGEEYYEEGKRFRDSVQDVMSGLSRKKVTDDQTVPLLAEVHRMLSLPKARRAKTSAKQMKLL
jgi:hypothetical protein